MAWPQIELNPSIFQDGALQTLLRPTLRYHQAHTDNSDAMENRRAWQFIVDSSGSSQFDCRIWILEPRVTTTTVIIAQRRIACLVCSHKRRIWVYTAGVRSRFNPPAQSTEVQFAIASSPSGNHSQAAIGCRKIGSALSLAIVASLA